MITTYSVNFTCSQYKYEKCKYAEFKDVFYAVRYENPLSKLAKGNLVNKYYLVLRNNVYIYKCTLIILCLLDQKTIMIL